MLCTPGTLGLLLNDCIAHGLIHGMHVQCSMLHVCVQTVCTLWHVASHGVCMKVTCKEMMF